MIHPKSNFFWPNLKNFIYLVFLHSLSVSKWQEKEHVHKPPLNSSSINPSDDLTQAKALRENSRYPTLYTHRSNNQRSILVILILKSMTSKFQIINSAGFWKSISKIWIFPNQCARSCRWRKIHEEAHLKPMRRNGPLWPIV